MSFGKFTDKGAEELTALGYSVVSRRYRQVARVDRPDWQKRMKQAAGRGDMGPDWYRRCISTDVLTVTQDVMRAMTNSRDCLRGYVEPPQ